MNTEIRKALDSIFTDRLKLVNHHWQDEQSQIEKKELIYKLTQDHIKSFNHLIQQRIQNELDAYGPLHDFIADPHVTEILVNNFDQIFIEKNGQLSQSTDFFYSHKTYENCIERVCQNCGSYINKEKPFIEFQLDQMRFTIIYKDLSRGSHILSIRKQPTISYSIDDLIKKNWCNQIEKAIVLKILESKKNFILVGGTSSGKTTVLQSLINELPLSSRQIIIEDTQELRLANSLSVSLLCRTDYLNAKNTVTMTDLLKRALRLRPDRLVVGEIRGGEATDLLMALSTGHEGSFGSLHAKNHHEALLRLEMLIQMGAPQWKQESIRRLIGLTINYIIVVTKKDGHRKLDGIYKITSVESTGISSHRIDSASEIN